MLYSGIELTILYYVVHQSERSSHSAVDQTTGEYEFSCGRSTNSFREPNGHLPYRWHPPVAVGIAQLGRFRCHQELASESQFQAAGEAMTSNLGNRWLGRDSRQSMVSGSKYRLGGALAGRDRLEIVSSGKGAPGSGEHNAMDSVVSTST